MLIIGRKEDPHKLLLLIETRNMIVSTQDKSFVTSRSEIFESTSILIKTPANNSHARVGIIKYAAETNF